MKHPGVLSYNLCQPDKSLSVGGACTIYLDNVTIAHVYEEKHAHILIAAPELLAALRHVHRYFAALDEMQPNANHGFAGRNIRELVHDTITKAETTI